MVRLVEGQIVAEDEDGAGGWLRRLLRCRTINFLGFRVPLYWSCVIVVFAGLKFGIFGLLFVAAAAGKPGWATLHVMHRGLTELQFPGGRQIYGSIGSLSCSEQPGGSSGAMSLLSRLRSSPLQHSIKYSRCHLL